MKELLDSIFSSSVSVVMNKQRTQSKLIMAGKKIAQAYLGATTRHGFDESPGWSVHAGQPILFLEYQGENLIFPFETHLSLDKGDYQLSWAFVNFEGKNYTLWILRTSPEYHVPKGSYDPARCLRIILLRLYAENQSLHHVIQNINDQSITDYGDRLQRYFQQTIPEVFKFEKKYDLDANFEFIALSRLAYDQALPGERGPVIQILKTIRPYVKVIIDEYMKKEEKIMTDEKYNVKAGDHSTIIIGSTISDSDFSKRYETHKEEIDLAKLAAELEILKAKMVQSAQGPIQKEVIEKVDEAKEQAEKQNGGKALKALEAVGKVLLKIAETAGTTVVTAAIKAAMGI
jgi:hypothetical protein